MLKNLTLTNFTAFSKAELNFSKGINVIIGRNGVGKSHLLKVGYSLLYTKHRSNLIAKDTAEVAEVSDTLFTDKIIKIFNIWSAEKISRKPSTTKGFDISYDVDDINNRRTNSMISWGVTNEITPDTEMPYWDFESGLNRTKYAQPVYITPKEILSIYPGLAQAIEDRELSFDDTYYDLAKALGRRPLKGKRLEEISDILLTIEKDVFGGGKFVEKNSQFYFEKESIGELEAPLVAEGLCKVGMLAHLLRNGSLVKGSTLSWDEPESNLNPQLQKLVAKAMTSLADYGIQVIIATHSLFLMRELDILTKQKDTDLRFFGLSEEADGVKVSQGDSIEDIDHIQSLEEELEQSGRYLEMEYGDE